MIDQERWVVICRLAPSYPWSCADIWAATYHCATEDTIVDALDRHFIPVLQTGLVDPVRDASRNPRVPPPPFEPLALTGVAAGLRFLAASHLGEYSRLEDIHRE